MDEGKRESKSIKVSAAPNYGHGIPALSIQTRLKIAANSGNDLRHRESLTKYEVVTL